MGQETRRSPQAAGTTQLVNALWASGAMKSIRALLVFRMTMVRLQRDHPEIFELVESIRRRVDMDHALMYDSDSQINSQPATKEAFMKGGEEE